ncbi:MAG: hypothetical protein ACK5G7_02235 [Erysipelotrichaceae bacterium]
MKKISLLISSLILLLLIGCSSEESEIQSKFDAKLEEFNTLMETNSYIFTTEAELGTNTVYFLNADSFAIDGVLNDITQRTFCNIDGRYAESFAGVLQDYNADKVKSFCEETQSTLSNYYLSVVSELDDIEVVVKYSEDEEFYIAESTNNDRKFKISKTENTVQYLQGSYSFTIIIDDFELPFSLD